MEDYGRVECPVCNHLISDFENCVSDPCEHVMAIYVDIINSEFVYTDGSWETEAEKMLVAYEEAEGDKYMEDLLEEYAMGSDFILIENSTSGISCGPSSSTEYILVRLKQQ